jgi:hypothetical protein
LLDEGGYAEYYQNGYYHSFYKQAVAHNTVLVGGYPESQNRGDLYNQVRALDQYPRISECTTVGIVDALESELSPVYKGRLNEFSRSILFVKPDYLILYDKIASDAPEFIQWLFHAANKDSIHTEKSKFYIRRPHAALRSEIIQPSTYEAIIRNHPDSEKAVLVISTTESSTAAKFLAVLIPSMEKNQKERDQWLVSPVDYPGWSGVQVRIEGVLDEICFREKWSGMQTLGCYRTDSDRFLVSVKPQGGITRLWIRNATSFSRSLGSGEPAFQVTADKPATIALQWRDSVLEIESNPQEELNFIMNSVNQPSSVKLNGREHPFRFDLGQIKISVPGEPMGNQ